MATGHSLAILTRPRGRSSVLSGELLRRHWSVLECPVLEIQEIDTHAEDVPRPEAFDLVVFVSRAAVAGYRGQLASVGVSVWPPQTAAACVGSVTAEAIRQAFGNTMSVICPDPDETQDSEGLLPLLLNMEQPLKKVLIVRGQNGREWLRERLHEMRIEVTVCQSYRRQEAQWPKDLSEQLIAFKNQGHKAIWLLTSVQGVEVLLNKLESLDLLDWFSQGQFVLTHARIGAVLNKLLARPLPTGNCLVANPQDASILACFERLQSRDASG